MSASTCAVSLYKASGLWCQWRDTHKACTQALSSALSSLERLQMMDFSSCDVVCPFEGLQTLSLLKQQAGFDRAMNVVHRHHSKLQGVVKDLERLYIEALRSLSSTSSLGVQASPDGPQPTRLDSTELLHDMWVMCRDELFLKVATVSLLTSATTPADAATLLGSYSAQPNVDEEHVDKLLAQTEQTTQK